MSLGIEIFIYYGRSQCDSFCRSRVLLVISPFYRILIFTAEALLFRFFLRFIGLLEETLAMRLAYITKENTKRGQLLSRAHTASRTQGIADHTSTVPKCVAAHVIWLKVVDCTLNVASSAPPLPDYGTVRVPVAH